MNGIMEQERFRRMIETLHSCMDDYLYILDLEADHYYISPSALERFCLEEIGRAHV